MDVTSATSATASTGTVSTSGTATISSDFNTFLRMLTVQMQNQDPLNPIDSADYAVQLATFSGVEQQVKTNQLLSDMQGKFQQLGMSEMASWIGKEARSAAAVRYDGSAVTLSPNPAVGANRAVLVVKDAEGNIVSREELPVSADLYQWLGGDAEGNPLPEGRYSLTLESWRNGEVLQEDPVEHYGRVVEARGGSDGIRLVFEGGIEIPATEISALRSAQN